MSPSIAREFKAAPRERAQLGLPGVRGHGCILFALTSFAFARR